MSSRKAFCQNRESIYVYVNTNDITHVFALAADVYVLYVRLHAIVLGILLLLVHDLEL